MRKFYAILTVALTLNLFVVSPALAAGAWDEIDTMESYTSGNDLNGGSGGSGWGGNWSANTAYDATNAASCSGTKSATITDANTSARNADRTIGGPDSGDLYFCVQGNTSYSDYMYVAFYSGATFAGEFGIVHLSGTSWRLYADGAGGTPGQLTSGHTHGTWLIYNVNFINCTTWKVRWKVKGGSWSSFSANQTWASSVSCPTTLRVYQGNDGSGNAVLRFDEIGTTDPDASAAPSFKPWQHWLF